MRKKTENGYCCYACGTCKTVIYLVAMRMSKNNLRSESGQIMSRLMRELFILCRCHFPRVGPSGANPLSLASSLGQSCTHHHFFQPQSLQLLFSLNKILKSPLTLGWAILSKKLTIADISEFIQVIGKLSISKK